MRSAGGEALSKPSLPIIKDSFGGTTPSQTRGLVHRAPKKEKRPGVRNWSCRLRDPVHQRIQRNKTALARLWWLSSAIRASYRQPRRARRAVPDAPCKSSATSARPSTFTSARPSGGGGKNPAYQRQVRTLSHRAARSCSMLTPSGDHCTQIKHLEVMPLGSLV